MPEIELVSDPNMSDALIMPQTGKSPRAFVNTDLGVNPYCTTSTVHEMLNLQTSHASFMKSE